MTKQRLRTQVQNIEKKKFFRKSCCLMLRQERLWWQVEDDVEALNEESDEIDHNLEVATDKQNRTDVAEVCVSVERSVC